MIYEYRCTPVVLTHRKGRLSFSLSCVLCSNLHARHYPWLNLAQFVMKVKVCVENSGEKVLNFS